VEKPGEGEEVVPVEALEFHGHAFGVDACHTPPEGAGMVPGQRDGELEELAGLGGETHQEEPGHGQVARLGHPRAVRSADLHREAGRHARVRPLRDVRDVKGGEAHPGGVFELS